MIKAILFDLDGTLLPMDQGVFIKAYFGGLAKKLAPLGYKSEELIGAIWQGTAMMVKNNGEKLNEERFWDAFAAVYGEDARKDESVLADFYENEFDAVQASCGFDKRARDVVDLIKERGYRVALATNPIFPAVATIKRMRWAGFEPSDFEHFTHYGNSRHCKPNLDYYRDILSLLSLKGDECVMVGNDVNEDMIARELGMRVFLLTDYIINKDGRDINEYPHGSFDDLAEFIKSL